VRPRRQVRHARINYPRKTQERTARHPLHRAHVRPRRIDRRVPLKHPVQQHPHTRHRHLFVPCRPPHRHQPRCRPVRRRRLQAAPSAPGRAPNAASASPSARSGGSLAHRTPRAERSYPYPPAKSPPPAPSSYTLQTAARLTHSDCPPCTETHLPVRPQHHREIHRNKYTLVRLTPSVRPQPTRDRKNGRRIMKTVFVITSRSHPRVKSQILLRKHPHLPVNLVVKRKRKRQPQKHRPRPRRRSKIQAPLVRKRVGRCRRCRRCIAPATCTVRSTCRNPAPESASL